MFSTKKLSTVEIGEYKKDIVSGLSFRTPYLDCSNLSHH